MTPFSRLPRYSISGREIRARGGLRLPPGGGNPVNFVQKGGNFVHGFPERRFPWDLRQSGRSPLRFLYNNRQYLEAKIGSGRTVVWPDEMKGVFGGCGITVGENN
jgi:hypothetical protein